MTHIDFSRSTHRLTSSWGKGRVKGDNGKRKERKGQTRIALKCVNDGKVFKSILEAERYYGFPRRAISNALTRPQGNYGEYRFVKDDSGQSEKKA